MHLVNKDVVTKVAIISPFPPPIEGVGEHTRNLAEAWVALGCDVLVVAPGHGEYEELEVDRGFRVVRELRPFSRRWARRVIDNFAPDLVYTQFAIATLTTNFFSALDLSRRARRKGSRTAMGFHEPVRELALLGPIGTLLYRSGVRVADVSFVFSTAAAESMHAKGVTSDAIYVPLGTPTLSEVHERDVSRVRLRYGLENSAVVLSLGFIHPDKGLSVLLDAATRVSIEAKRPVKFLIAGEPRKRNGVFRFMGQIDQRLFLSLKDRAASLAESVDIEFSGFVPVEDIAPLLKASTVMALAYTNATQSATASLASAAGVPVVATDLPGLREALGEGAIYVSPGDADALASALAKILNDDHLRATLVTEIDQLRHDGTYTAIAARILGAAIA